MGQTSIYIFPLNDRPGFVKESIDELIRAGVIFPEPYAGSYASGDAPWARGAFDHLGIHQSRLPYIIPQDPAIEPKCPGCGMDVSEAYYDKVNEIDDTGDEVDWGEVTVTCPKCHQEFRLTALIDRVGVFCAREYLYLSDVQVEDLAEFEGQISKVLGGAQLKSYWYT